VSRIGAHLIIDKACTDLTDTNTAQFIQSGKFESDSGISAASELVTLLKALTNGNSAGGLTIADLGDGVLAGDAINKGQLDELGIISVDSFGTVGDGVADDLAAIQSAFDAAPSGGEVVFGSGKTYLISGTLVAPIGLRINGRYATLKRSTVNTMLTMDVAGSLKDLNFDGNNTLTDATNLEPLVIMTSTIRNLEP
jgi:hypothetical protein